MSTVEFVGEFDPFFFGLKKHVSCHSGDEVFRMLGGVFSIPKKAQFREILRPQKLTCPPENVVVGRRSGFPFEMAPVWGKLVSFRGLRGGEM